MKKTLTMIAAVAVLYSNMCRAAVTIDVVESGGDVVATASGSINTTDLVRNINWSSIGSFVRGSGSVPPVNGQIILAPVSGATAMASYTVSTDIVFSTGPVIYAGSSSGDRIGILSTISSPTTDLIYLDTDYVSGSPLSATATWSGSTFADLGLIPGTYIVNWGSAENADSLTLNIGPANPTPTYTVGGTVTGLSGTVTLTNNATDDLVVNANGAFEFATALDDLTDYLVAVSVQPSGQTCSVSNGIGTISGVDVTDVGVNCIDDLPPPIAREPTAVPADSNWALMLLTLSLMIFGGLMIRRDH